MKLILRFPQRGSPPPDQEGYERDIGNPFVFRLKWIPCNRRELITIASCTACPKGKVVDHCKQFDTIVTQQACYYCTFEGKLSNG